MFKPKEDKLMNNQTPYFDLNSEENEINTYFDTLPKNVQETIVQSHGSISSLAELKNIANNLMAK